MLARSNGQKKGGSVNGAQAVSNKRESPDEANKPGDQYLQHIGLKRDPFWATTAEDDFSERATWDLSLPNRFDFSPLSYYVDPESGHNRTQTLESLGEGGHAFVFGAPGSGKTALRLAQAARIRREPKGVLGVTYQLNGRTSQELDREEHYLGLTKALAVDLFIQIVEQFGNGPTPTDGMDQRLSLLLHMSGKHVWRVVERLAQDEEPDSSWGYAEAWFSLNRPLVWPVLKSARLKTWLEGLWQLKDHAHWQEEPSGIEAWEYALETARLWRFDRVYALVDGERAVDSSEPAIMTLLAMLPELEQARVHLKIFLPPEMESAVDKALFSSGRTLEAFLVIRLKWDKEELRRLLRERFREARSPREGFADLVEPSMAESFDDELIAAAENSPRKLLRLIKELIQVHAGRAVSLEAPITAEEWETAKCKAMRHVPQPADPARAEGRAKRARKQVKKKDKPIAGLVPVIH